MKKLLSIFILCGFLVSANAQHVYFNERYHFSGQEVIWSVLELESGYLCAVGAGTSDEGLLLYFLDSAGNKLTEKFYSESGSTFYAGFTGSLIKTSEGGFALGGSMDTGLTSNAMLWRFDENGDTLWTKTYGSPAYDQVGNQCKQTPDGGFVIIGATDKLGTNDILLIKTDSLGNLEWDTTFGGPGAQSGFTILVTSEGNYLFRGSDSVYMVDQSGNILWKKIYTGSFAYFIETSNGYFVGCGGEFDTFLSGSFQQNWPTIIKIDTAGTVIWQKRYGPSRFVAGLNSIWELPDGNFVAAGQSNNNMGTPNGNGFPIGFILKVSAQGDSIWYREHEYDTCIKNQDYIRDMKPTSDGGFITAGFFAPRTSSPCLDTGGQDMWVMKLDSCGCAYPGCDSMCSQLVGIEDFQFNNTTLTLKIYPNPASNMTTVRIPNSGEGTRPSFANASVGKNYHLRVYDITGRELKSYTMHNQPTITINTKELGSGLYFLRLSALGGKQDGRMLGSGKLLVE
ncbi:MAG: T9SS type A sorting domain-containing protein [Flavobacteriales bacterium]|nr:T9SS type A sorting domain-containing protein [Flavobacteriales bacterium]